MINIPSTEEFLGWHVGDGCISVTKKRNQYTLTGDLTQEFPFYKKVISPSFNKIFLEYLDSPVILRKYESVGVCGIYIFNKKFINMLKENFDLPVGKKLNIQIPKIIRTKE